MYTNPRFQATTFYNGLRETKSSHWSLLEKMRATQSNFIRWWKWKFSIFFYAFFQHYCQRIGKNFSMNVGKKVTMFGSVLITRETKYFLILCVCVSLNKLVFVLISTAKISCLSVGNILTRYNGMCTKFDFEIGVWVYLVHCSRWTIHARLVFARDGTDFVDSKGTISSKICKECPWGLFTM